MNNHSWLKEKGFIGFTNKYLEYHIQRAKADEQIDIQIFTKLVKLDTKLGTKDSEQLCCCLDYTTRSDIIKVYIYILNDGFKIISDF